MISKVMVGKICSVPVVIECEDKHNLWRTDDTDVSPLSCSYIVVGEEMKLTTCSPMQRNCTLPFHEHLGTLMEGETKNHSWLGGETAARHIGKRKSIFILFPTQV